MSQRAGQTASRPRRLFRPRDVVDRRGVPGRQTVPAAARRRRRRTKATPAAAADVWVRGGRLRRAGDARTERPSVGLVRRTVALQRHRGRRMDAQLQQLRRLQPSDLPMHPE